MQVITTLTKQQIEFLMAWGVKHKDTYTYYHIPKWFADLGKGEFEVLNFEQLPNYVREDLKDILPIKEMDY